MNPNSKSKGSIGLEVKVTDRCNHRCFYCVNDDGGHGGNDLDGKAFSRRLLDWAETGGAATWDLSEVRMTGGEPLMNLSALLEIARACQRLGIPSGVNSNASLLDRKNADLLAGAGIRTFKASIDALEDAAAKRMGGASCSPEKILGGIRVALSRGFYVILRFTLSSLNRDQLLKCYRLACELGVAKFQVKPLIRAGRAVGSDAFMTEKETAVAFRELAEVAASAATKPELLCVPPGDGAGLPVKVCGSMNKIYIATSMDAVICNYISPHRPFGNLKVDSLTSILDRRKPVLANDGRGFTAIQGCPQVRPRAGA